MIDVEFDLLKVIKVGISISTLDVALVTLFLLLLMLGKGLLDD